jgi:ribonuclease HI
MLLICKEKNDGCKGYKMAKITIVCDASYNEDIHLGGYSGAIFIEQPGKPDTHRVIHGVAPDSPNSNDSEMLAIAACVEHLSIMMKEQGLTPTEININTDSRTAINQYSLFKDGLQHADKYSKTLSLMDKHLSPFEKGSQITFKKVKAHVPDHEANGIEKLHNLVDKAALSARWLAQDHVFKPNVDDTPFYGVILPAYASGWQRHDLEQLGYTHAKRGLIARVAFVGKVEGGVDNHPFIKGIKRAAEERGRSFSDCFRIERHNPKGGRVNGLHGLDRVLLRDYFSNQNKRSHHINMGSASYQFAGVASRLIYGNQAPKLLNTKHLNGRLEKASQFVINTVIGRKNPSPFSTNEWMEEFTSRVDVGYVPSLKEALVHATPERDSLLVDIDQPYREAIEEVLKDTGELEPAHFAVAFESCITSHGIDLDDALKARLEGYFTVPDSSNESVCTHCQRKVLNYLANERDNQTKENNKTSPEAIPNTHPKKEREKLSIGR